MWTVVPDIYNVFTAPHIQASVFNWTYQRCHWRYVDNSVSATLQTLCQIRRTSSRLRNVNYGPGHIQCNYSSTYSGFNIQQNVAPLVLEICPQFNERYTANLEPNITHIPQFTLCELWSRSYTMHLQLSIFSLQYSTVGICAATADISTMLRALNCKPGTKWSAHPPVYAMSTVDTSIYKVLTFKHI
jgi:hypothetical protein